MNWKTILSEIQAQGLSQAQIAARLDKSQAWVSAVSQSKYEDLRWQDGQNLIALHAELTTNTNQQQAA